MNRIPAPVSRRSLLIAAGGALAGRGLAAEPAYPSKPLTLLVALQAGSASDIAARIAGESLARRIGQAVVVENLPGAAGLIGASRLFKSRPDGYTFAALNNGLVCLVPNLPSKPTFDIGALTPVSMIANLPSVLIVPASLPVQNLAELVQLSQREPDRLAYGSVGNASPQHVAMEMLKQATGARLLHVPYKGGPQAVAELVAGQIQVIWTAISVALPFLKTGQVKALVIGERRRSQLLPSVPTLQEAGVGSFAYEPWLGLYAPPQTPAPLAQRVHAELQAILREPELGQRFAAAGLEPVQMEQAAFAQRNHAERIEMAAVVKQLNIS